MESLFFIAVVPPEPIFDEVQKLKEFCKDRFNSKQALRSPPHITLHMPFKLKEKKVDLLYESLLNIAHGTEEFEVILSGFGFFKPRVVFVSVDQSLRLSELQASVKHSLRTRLKILNADYKQLPFHPHMTLAFRDLSKSQFLNAEGYFASQKYERHFKCDRIALLKHNGSHWEVAKTFTFAS